LVFEFVGHSASCIKFIASKAFTKTLVEMSDNLFKNAIKYDSVDSEPHQNNLHWWFSLWLIFKCDQFYIQIKIEKIDNFIKFYICIWIVWILKDVFVFANSMGLFPQINYKLNVKLNFNKMIISLKCISEWSGELNNIRNSIYIVDSNSPQSCRFVRWIIVFFSHINIILIFIVIRF
jgi:hypothetical protein